MMPLVRRVDRHQPPHQVLRVVLPHPCRKRCHRLWPDDVAPALRTRVGQAPRPRKRRRSGTLAWLVADAGALPLALGSAGVATRSHWSPLVAQAPQPRSRPSRCRPDAAPAVGSCHWTCCRCLRHRGVVVVAVKITGVRVGASGTEADHRLLQRGVLDHRSRREAGADGAGGLHRGGPPAWRRHHRCAARKSCSRSVPQVESAQATKKRSTSAYCSGVLSAVHTQPASLTTTARTRASYRVGHLGQQQVGARRAGTARGWSAHPRRPLVVVARVVLNWLHHRRS